MRLSTDYKNMSPPLLHDHHTHPLLYAAFRQAVDLSNVRELEEACDLINERRDRYDVVVAHSWKNNYFDFPAATLDSLPPCAIFNLSLHKVLINESGQAELKNEFGSDVEKVADQDWFERNLRHVLNWFALLGGSAAALTEFYQYLESVGVHSAEEMLLIDGCEIDWFRDCGLLDRTRIWAAPDTYERLSAEHKDIVAGFKFFTDGAFGSRTAAISQPYIGQPKNRGMLMYSDDELASNIDRCAIGTKGIAIHAIGDVAIEQTIVAIENCRRRDAFKEIRIEDAQLISADQARRAKGLGIILSMQPNFNGDTLSYSDRLRPEFSNANNPFRMLIDEQGFEPGVDLIFGSDGMPHGRKVATEQSFNPPLESQRLSQQEFESGYSGKC